MRRVVRFSVLMLLLLSSSQGFADKTKSREHGSGSPPEQRNHEEG